MKSFSAIWYLIECLNPLNISFCFAENYDFLLIFFPEKIMDSLTEHCLTIIPRNSYFIVLNSGGSLSLMIFDQINELTIFLLVLLRYIPDPFRDCGGKEEILSFCGVG